MINRQVFFKYSLAACAAGVGSTWAQTDALRIGLTPVILADQAAFLTRWSQYLTERLDHPVVFIARESYQGVLDLLFSGQLDAAWICGYPYTRHQQQLQLLAVPLYAGSPTYQAYLIRSRQSNSSVKSWADLKGKVLAYSDPLSNSGWLVAQVQLQAASIDSRDLKKSFFAHSHRNVAEAVAARLAHAGSIDGYVWETMRQQRMAAVEQTEVIWKSELFGFPPLVVRQLTKHPKTQALQEILIQMQHDRDGQSLLKLLNLTGFAIGKASQFSSIATMAQLTESRAR